MEKIPTFIIAPANHLTGKAKAAFVNTPQAQGSRAPGTEVSLPPPSQLAGAK